jgi:mono/diheme cytochrome c family protein
MKAFWIALSLLLASTATAAPSAQIERGKYLVGLLACAACHTDGQLISQPREDRYLAGSSIGIAYSNDEKPGVVFPANLTPDKETGLGRWKAEDIVRNIQHGIDRHGRQQVPVMPWPGYANMDVEDVQAIAAYLMSLPAVKHEVPKNVAPNEDSTAPYIRYGIYVFDPKGKLEKRLDAVKVGVPQ